MITEPRTGKARLFSLITTDTKEKFQNGVMDGEGCYVNGVHISFVGTWTDGKKHGTFIVTHPDGRRLICEYSENKCICKKKKSY